MRIKDALKTIDVLRKPVKRCKNYYEFLADARDFSNNYAENSENKGDFRYRLMLLVHNLEKGMCREDARPYGKDKVERIINILKASYAKDQDLFEIKLAKAMLISWKKFYDEKSWDLDINIKDYIDSLGTIELEAGRDLFCAPRDKLNSGSFSDVVFSRRSVRDFEEIPIKQEDIDFALDCFLHAPTACNRQMCKVYQIENENNKKLLINTILGIGGFNAKNVTLFLITYDIGAFEFYGERNQGYVNVGLTAMNFANGLHARGIGSCFMQWSNKRAEDKMIRQALCIPERERIGLVLGAGYYKEESFIPCSARRERKDVFKKI